MTIQSFLISKTSFQHLALFLCHLFVDGNFRSTHILYQPNAFDFDLLSQISSVCSQPIPIYVTDVTQPWTDSWNQNDTPDTVLQVIFLNSQSISNDIDKIGNRSALYRVFAFPSNDTIDVRRETSVIETIHKLCCSDSLVLHYYTESVSIYIDDGLNEQVRSNENMCSKSNPILIVNQETNFTQLNLFDRTFGEYERRQTIAINIGAFYRDKISVPKIIVSVAGALTNHYHLHLNSSYINMTFINHYDYNGPRTNRKFTLNPRESYKELSTDFKPIEEGNR